MPSAVQLLQRAVTPAQPEPEFGLAGGAIAVGSVFIGHMPHGERRMMRVPFCHLLCNRRRAFPVFQAIDTEENTHAVGTLPARNIYRQHLRVSGGQPGRLRGCGRGQAYVNAVLPYLIDNPVQPFKAINAFVRLQPGPGKNREGQEVDPRLFEKPHILFNRFIIPLVGVVIPSVINSVCFFHCCSYLRPLAHMAETRAYVRIAPVPALFVSL